MSAEPCRPNSITAVSHQRTRQIKATPVHETKNTPATAFQGACQPVLKEVTRNRREMPFWKHSHSHRSQATLSTRESQLQRATTSVNNMSGQHGMSQSTPQQPLQPGLQPSPPQNKTQCRMALLYQDLPSPPRKAQSTREVQVQHLR